MTQVLSANRSNGVLLPQAGLANLVPTSEQTQDSRRNARFWGYDAQETTGVLMIISPPEKTFRQNLQIRLGLLIIPAIAWAIVLVVAIDGPIEPVSTGIAVG